MRKHIWVGSILLLLSGIFPLFATNIYPDWFIHPGTYPQLITGYTYNGMSAQDDALNMYCAFKECIVVGTLEIFEENESDELLKNSNYFYYFSPDSVEALEGKFYEADAFDVSTFTHDRIAAFSFDSTQTVSTLWMNAEEIERPSWVDKTFFRDQNFYYGVGMYTALGRENDGWKTAEEQAIFTILTALAVEVHHLKIDVRTGDAFTQSMDQISFLKIKYLLRNIQVLERYPDRQNKLYYVLVRIPRNGLVSPLMK